MCLDLGCPLCVGFVLSLHIYLHGTSADRASGPRRGASFFSACVGAVLLALSVGAHCSRRWRAFGQVRLRLSSHKRKKATRWKGLLNSLSYNFLANMSGGPCAAAPSAPLRILIAHEQHLQPMGCDVRLLGIIRELLAIEGVEVSMLFRAHTLPLKRSPSSDKLARILHIPRGFKEEWLRSELPPPALYEYVSPAQLAHLFQRGWFNSVLIFFWFWHDPKPNVAELVLPLLHAFSPRGRRPFAAILSDDAHAIRDAKLGKWESDPETARNHTLRAADHAQREAAAYAFADQVLHITPADSDLERTAFPFVRRFGLLRLSLSHSSANVSSSSLAAAASTESSSSHFGSSTSLASATTASSAIGGGSSPSPLPYIGFLGNGATPTNSLAIQWFLTNCWPALRARHPALRLRLVGLPPGHRIHADGRAHAACGRADAHCGWASRTRYHGIEAASGIDELGFMEDTHMLAELARWQLMVVPVLHTTGVNTKVYSALQVGLPLIISTAAAAPFDFPPPAGVSRGAHEADSPALLADDAASFVSASTSLLEDPAARARMSTSARAHWQRLAAADPSREDVRNFVRTICSESAAKSPPSRARGASAVAAEATADELFMPSTKLSALPVLATATGELAAAGGAYSAALTGDDSEDDGLPLRNSTLRPTRCFGSAQAASSEPQGGSTDEPMGGLHGGMLPVTVGVHTASLGEATFAKRLVAGVWRTVCAACAMRCALPPERTSSAPLVVRADTQLAVLSYGRQQVPDFDGMAAVAHLAGAGGTDASARPILGAQRFVHFTQDLGDQLSGDGCAVGSSAALSALHPAATPAAGRTESWQTTHGVDFGGGTSGRGHMNPLVRLPGLSATRMMIRAASSMGTAFGTAAGNRTILCMAPIQRVCQERAVWRAAFRFVGIHSSALPEVWRHLAHDWPALFSCNRTTTGTGTDTGAALVLTERTA